jgi:hypothetical protein
MTLLFRIICSLKTTLRQTLIYPSFAQPREVTPVGCLAGIPAGPVGLTMWLSSGSLLCYASKMNTMRQPRADHVLHLSRSHLFLPPQVPYTLAPGLESSHNNHPKLYHLAPVNDQACESVAPHHHDSISELPAHPNDVYSESLRKRFRLWMM